MGKRGPKPVGRVLTEWSSEFAYALGLLTTDGSLSKDGRHINFTSGEEAQIRNFQDCLNLKDIKVGRKASGFTSEKKYYQIQFGDVLFFKWLLDFGLMPNKSKTLGVLKVPDKYFFDFLRGCFDGDGSINAYWDPRWHSSYMYYVNFASASPAFLDWLLSTIERLAGIRGCINAGGRGVQHLRYAKYGTKILLDEIYYSDNAPCLKRKFTKAQKIFTIDQQHNNES